MLALLVSPAAAAACEIACATPAHAAHTVHQVPSDPHAHHHMPDGGTASQAEVPPTDDGARYETSACDLSAATLARPRQASTDIVSPSAPAGGVLAAAIESPVQVAAPESPHAPPHRSSIPLRI